MPETIAASRVITALADPTRRAILARLATGELTAGEVASPLKMSQPAVSHHLKVLEQAGLIRRRVDGQRRPCAIIPEALAPLEDWLSDLRYRMEGNFARLDRLLAAMDDSERNGNVTES